MLVQEFLERTADRLPEKIGLVADGRRMTYAEIEAQANQFANTLAAHGIRRGDRVLIFLPNCLEAVVAIFGTLKAGSVFVVVNATTRPNKLAYIANNCQAKAIVIPGRHAHLVRGLAAQAPSICCAVLTGLAPGTVPEAQEWFIPFPNILLFHEILARYSSQRPAQVNIDLDLACLVYTSGSTGDPKGVMCDHNNVDFVTSSIIQYLENSEEDVIINLLPLSFDYGLYQVLMTFKFGGRLVLEKGFLYPAQILKRIEQEKVTGFPGVPTIFAQLAQMDLSTFNVSSIRYLTNTAAALPVKHIEQIRSQFPKARLFSMYGLTETKRTLYLPPEELDRRPDSVGIAIPGTEVWLEDETGSRLGPGQVGELVVRGRHVMRGYWNDPELTALRFRPGPIPGERLCYSGDLFRSDDEGFFYFIARKDDIIKSRGEKVSPLEVERVLYALEGVVEAAVIGVPDPILGQAIKAFIVAPGVKMDRNIVLSHCRAHLEDFMVPRYVEICEALPKTGSGKIQKNDLR